MSGAGQNETLSFYLSASQVIPNETNSQSLSNLLSEHDTGALTSGLLSSYAQNNETTSYFGKDSFQVNASNKSSYSKELIGLYCHYAAVGCVYGISGAYYPICAYEYKGPGNVCANSKNIIFLAWGLKFIIYYFIEKYCFLRSFGNYQMIFGWAGVISVFASLAIIWESLPVELWLVLQLLVQLFLVIADGPADSICVAISLSSPDDIGKKTLATAQRIRFLFCMGSGLVQAVLLNGPDTNSKECSVSWWSCWSWGLTLRSYYLLYCTIVSLALIALLALKVINVIPSSIANFNSNNKFGDISSLFQRRSIRHLIVYIYVFGFFCSATNPVNIIMEYYILKMSNLQSGVNVIGSYIALVGAMYTFQKYLSFRNWKNAQYFALIIKICISILWIGVYNNFGNSQNSWNAVLLDMLMSFSQGLDQVIISTVVVELTSASRIPGSVDLLVSVSNTVTTVASIVAVQFLLVANSSICTEDNCPSTSIDVSTTHLFSDSDGPRKFTSYNIGMISLATVMLLVVRRWIPSSRVECERWKAADDSSNPQISCGIIFGFVFALFTSYGIVVRIFLLSKAVSCGEFVGGSGCS